MENPYLSMLGEVFADLLPVLPYFIGIVAFIIALKVLEAKFSPKKRRRWRRSSNWERRPFQPKHDFPAKVPDAADQLRTVMLADFKAQPLLNKSEARLFRAMDKLVIELAPPGWQVMAQVSLGEILRSDNDDAYRCINTKRVDLLIVEPTAIRAPRSSTKAAGITRAAPPPATRSRKKRCGGHCDARSSPG